MNKREKKLVDVFSDLDDMDQNSLMTFAEFLRDKAKKEGRLVVTEELVHIPRPQEERVVAAIKRLSAAFPMLKKDRMLNETAALMSEHIVQGRPAVEVIDELEIMFHNRYEAYCLERNSENDEQAE